MKLKAVNSNNVVKPAGGYAQAVDLTNFNRLVFVSGQIPMSLDGEVPTNFADQCDLVWNNVSAQLEAAGMGIDNLVKVTIFLASREYVLENRDIRNQFLKDHAPALTVIITGIFDDSWLLEIEAIAAD